MSALDWAPLAGQVLVLGVVLPLAALALLVLAMLIGRQPQERRVHQIVGTTLSVSLILASSLVVMLGLGLIDAAEADLGTLIAVRGYHFDLALHADLYGAIFLWLDMLLCGLVGAFSAQYLHQDEGFHRFYILLVAFVSGLALIATGAGLDLIFAGWEVVGLSSALLIAFFIRREAPVENGLRAYAVYRVTDMGLLIGVVALHHELGTTHLADLGALGGMAAVSIGALLVFGAMGKGAIVPFTPWLPRAMEGPTPSSAIFYGALSIHASPFLLIRMEPLVDQSLALRAAIVGLGLLTSVHATMVGRVQTDIKTSLGYASVTQVGLMWVWIGLGWTPLAVAHLVGHAILRTWQLLRAPSLLHDRHQIVRNLGAGFSETGRHLAWVTPTHLRRWAYRFALERWYLDDLWDAVVSVLRRSLRAIDAIDRSWAGLLGDHDQPIAARESAAERVEARGT